jgi:hypothetical protein
LSAWARVSAEMLDFGDRPERSHWALIALQYTSN